MATVDECVERLRLARAALTNAREEFLNLGTKSQRAAVQAAEVELVEAKRVYDAAFEFEWKRDMDAVRARLNGAA
jgi:hypothetical protein